MVEVHNVDTGVRLSGALLVRANYVSKPSHRIISDTLPRLFSRRGNGKPHQITCRAGGPVFELSNPRTLFRPVYLQQVKGYRASYSATDQQFMVVLLTRSIDHLRCHLSLASSPKCPHSNESIAG